ncbi:phage tail tape measure protein [Aeromonas sp. QDB03]|uniref:phage tail tape measure protein n=1 Tax=Aeromonas sp. QDB03 TaxID=2989839 RepID=UPI0022E280CD|nr:phage tail tape measure protein [Aeromonas sp. QDB03]
MGKQLVTDIVINLAGNLANKARQYGQSMTQFAANNQRAMNMLKMSASAAGRGIDALGNRYVALGAAVVGGSAVRGFSQLDRRISRIAIAAEISREKSAELYDEIQRVSNLKGIRIDPAEATSAIEEILTKTGDLEYAIANLPNIAAVIQATGAGGLEVGGIFTEFKKLNIQNNEAAMRAIDTLNLQGKSGAFTLGNMAKEGPKIFAAYAATGRQGAEAVTELGAALQVIRQGVGSDAEAVTAFESIIRDLTRPDTVKKLKQLGSIQVFDPEQLKQGKEVMRSLPALIEEIVTKSGGLSSKLSMLNLTDEAKRALKPVIAEFVQTGDVKAFDEFLQLSGDGTTTLNDAAVAANDFAASLQLVSNSWNQFANQQLAGPVAELANAINSLEPDAVQNWLETGKNIALVVGGLVAVKKGVDAVRWTKGVWDAAKPSKGGTGGMGGAMADLGATPVYVVNMPGGGMGGPDLGGGGQGKPGTKPGRFSPAGLVQFGTVAAGISMIPDFSPINISRANGMSASGIPQAPGILDVFDEMKAFFTRDISASPRPDNLSGTLDINVRDDRITVRTRDTAPGLKVNVDNGPSLMP